MASFVKNDQIQYFSAEANFQKKIVFIENDDSGCVVVGRDFDFVAQLFFEKKWFSFRFSHELGTLFMFQLFSEQITDFEKLILGLRWHDTEAHEDYKRTVYFQPRYRQEVARSSTKTH